MTHDTLIGIDAGTSAVKVCAFDREGRLLAKAQRSDGEDAPAETVRRGHRVCPLAHAPGQRVPRRFEWAAAVLVP